MDLTDIKIIKALCQEYFHKPNPGWGQHFLINQEILSIIVKAADLQSSETVLEVGSGLGVLTQELIKHAKKVVAVEADPVLAKILPKILPKAENLEVINANILKLDDELKVLGQNYKIVSNLPYNISSNFLEKFLTTPPKPKEMILMLQQEVAKRICAKPGSLSILGLSVQLYSQPELAAIVPKKNFWPVPDVDSAIVRIKLFSQKSVKSHLSGLSEKSFFQLVRIGFSARRKQLHNNLANGLKISNQIAKEVFLEIGLDQAVRAQELSVEQWITLANKLKNYLN